MSDVAAFDDEGLLFSTTYDDLYFSRHDGRAECGHVFLAGNELPERWEGVDDFSIGELGFGTGLNFLETWRQWQATRRPGQTLTFTSVEALPLSVEVAREALARWPELSDLTQTLLVKWDSVFVGVMMDNQTHLHVHHGDCLAYVPKFPKIDAWYLDGFSPAKNPSMWSEDLMQIVGERTKAGGTCASYTAAGWVRRNLEAAGFVIEKRPGFGTKRDMIVGLKS